MSPYIPALILLWELFDLSSVMPVTASHRRFHHHHRYSDYDLEESVPRELSLQRLPAEPSRRWRSLYPRTQDNETGHFRGRPKRHNNDDRAITEMYEVDAQHADYVGMCDYDKTRIKWFQDHNGNNITTDLYEIKCKSPTSDCHTGGSHCCLQTYTNIAIVYYDSKEEKERSWIQKIYTGCVCAHKNIANAIPQLDTTYKG